MTAPSLLQLLATTMPQQKLTNQDYLRHAIRSPQHIVMVSALALLTLLALYRHAVSLALVLILVELLFILFVPLLPEFRRKCDLQIAREEAEERERILEGIAQKLSPAAKARFESLQKLREKILDALRVQPCAHELESLWGPRLKMLQEWALRLLVAIGATRMSTKDTALLEEEIEGLKAQIQNLEEGYPRRGVKEQRLKLAEERLKRSHVAQQKREEAIVQFEAIEGIFEEILTRGTVALNQDEFASKLELIGSQVVALGESVEDTSFSAPTASPWDNEVRTPSHAVRNS